MEIERNDIEDLLDLFMETVERLESVQGRQGSTREEIKKFCEDHFILCFRVNK